ncbi:Frizzy aggregation protein FrzCD [Andreprevotia sp. IGB-42]|uniref:methyl-accepting chemotaxis protein n=1 Tax=Andreprevotia sp. IGB-42 TaxID=2497473 RepID=UPI001356BCEB|nr:CHASE3 domain-containing protein [Andreprevotia sp. IGB-42]KAF0815332.1 Frizzy aggregation protein FrzCD [Andreprevotia sp. IGB-42]
MKFSIGAKIWLSFVAILIVIVVIGSTAYQSINTLIEAAGWRSHTYQVRTALAVVLSNLKDAETGQRGYLITGEDRYLEPYRAALQQMDGVQAELKTLTADNPAQQQRITSLAPLVQAKMSELKETIDLRTGKGFEAARAVVLTDRGKNVMGQIRAIVREMDDAEAALLKTRDEGVQESSRASQLTILIGFLAAVIIVIAAGIFLTRNIGQPLREVTGIAEKISSGDLSVGLDPGNRSDEVGQLLRAFSRMGESLRGMAAVAEKIAAGDLRVEIVRQSERDALGIAFGKMITTLRDMNGELQGGIDVLSGSASEILAGTTQISTGAEETATSISETSSTVEEIKQTANVASQKSKTVSETAQRAAQVSQAGRKAVDEVADGMQRIYDQMAQVADSIVRLSEQTQQIGEIITTVNDLAEQSNLLAVNASIEAAKAGEQGKGFAVVAQEVKSLAEQSKQATVQVRGILGEVQKATSGAVLATEQGSKAVEVGLKQSNEAGEAIRQLADTIVENAQAAAQIAISAQQQLAGMDQLALAMDNIRTASSQNIASARQSEITAQGLHDLGQKLRGMLARFKL